MTTSRLPGVDVLVPQHVACLTPWAEAGILGPAEVHFAAWLARATGEQEPAVLLGAAMAVWAAANGHTCVELGRVAELAVQQARRTSIIEAPIAGVGAAADDVQTEEVVDHLANLEWPSPDSWRAALASAGSVRTVEVADPHEVAEPEPLVLCGNRLYLQRYWADECIVAADVRQRCGVADDTVSAEVVQLLEVVLRSLDPDGSPNRQRLAADTALSRRLSLVVGGPGTGKTYSVARVLAALTLQAQQQGTHLRIALAAPTGKAAARMGESIAAAVVDDSMRDHVPESVRDELVKLAPTTIHRLLGPLGPDRLRFRHDATNPLPHDVVLIDETSMVSLPLLARLCEAVRPDARLVLIGDPDQLESVELGAVLGDLVEASGVDALVPPAPGPLTGHAVRLLRAHRFETDSPIALLADAIRDDRPDEVLERLRATVTPGSPVRFAECDDPRRADVAAIVRDVLQPVLVTMRDAARAGDAEGALEALRQVRMLCGHRRGPYGVSHWNREAERWMYGEQGAGTTWFAGRPVLITRNDPRLGLANGDTGVVIAGSDGPVVAFRRAADLVTFDPVQLEQAETAFAMTVHKSQGSEFPHVVLVLPPHDSPLIGRELLYTAITRASRELLVVGSEPAVRGCVVTSEQRMTGLPDALR